MRSKKPLGIALMGLGLLLLGAALALVLHNRAEDQDAGQAADAALSALQTAISENTAPAEAPTEEVLLPTEAPGETEAQAETAEEVPPLPTYTMEDHDYVGYLDIPALKLNLPVMKIVYVDDLQLAPCLEQGSPYSDDAVIAAHNYPSHFGKLKELTAGEEVTFTDLNGQPIRYSVAEVKTIAPTDVELVRDSEHDLVLYTCTPGGQSRVMVACDRQEA